MRNIFYIFKSDILKLRKNVIAIIVVMGICIVPCLYAWFNIAASFDPYADTNHLKVGVVNEDEGYSGVLSNFDINFGRDVLVYLSENPKLDWILTDRKKAMENLYKDKYYALIIIPKDFSKDMMSVFSNSAKTPSLIYYVNEKKNAIAPKITDKEAQKILNYINHLFSKNLYQSILKSIDFIKTEVGEKDENSLSEGFITNLEKISSTLGEKINQLKEIKKMGSMTKLTIDDGESLYETANKNFTDLGDNLKTEEMKISENLKKLIENLNRTESLLLETRENIKQNLNFLDKYTDDVNARDLSDLLDSIKKNIEEEKEKFVKIQNDLNSPDLILADDMAKKTGDIISLLDKNLSKLNSYDKNLNADINFFSGIKKSMKYDLKAMDEKIEDIGKIKSEKENKLDMIIKNISKNTDEALSFENIKKKDKNSKDLKSSFEKFDLSVDLTIKQIEDIKGKIDSFLLKIKGLNQNDTLESVDEILKQNPKEISDFLKAPVKYETKRIYPVKNYGSAMAPFYSTLAIWVGAIVMASMMKVNVQEETLKKLKNPKPRQIYFGRHIIFTLFGLVQSSLIILGDRYYLGIQCENTLKLLIAGWITSLVYVNIVYTLTVSFGDVGKAISVVVMVMQVAGSGGTFPIQVTPSFFQKIYPFLPFVHSMNAMRECIGGFYKDIYIKEILLLMAFMIPSLMLGLIFRKPVVKLNQMFTEKLENTKLM